MRKSLTRISKAVLIAGAALAFAATQGSPASACPTPAPAQNNIPTTSTLTYAFYAGGDYTDTPQTQSPAPIGWRFKENVDYENDSDACRTTILNDEIEVYVCTVPRAQMLEQDANLIVTTTDDGELSYLDGTVLDPINGGPTTNQSSRPTVYA